MVWQAIIAHVVHLVNRDYMAMCQDYYTLQFMDPSVDTTPIAPALAQFFDNVLDRSVQELNFKARSTAVSQSCADWLAAENRCTCSRWCTCWSLEWHMVDNGVHHLPKL